MSKQSDAKESQGYSLVSGRCGNCAHLKFDVVMPAWMRSENLERVLNGLGPIHTYAEPSRFRCSLGGFSVKRSATCRLWSQAKVDN